MEEIEQKIKEIMDENKKIKEEIKEKEYIINNCREKIKDLKESNRNLSRIITLKNSQIKRLDKR